MSFRIPRYASSAALLLLAISTVAQKSPQPPAISTHARAIELLHQSMTALGGEEKLRAIHAIELKGIGFRNELEQSERPEGPWMPDFFQSDEIRDFANTRYRTVRQSKTLNNSSWDDAAWSDPLVLVTAGGSAALFSQGKFNAISSAGVPDIEETLALDPLQVLLTALAAPDLRLGPDAQVHGFTQQVIEFTWKGEPVRIFLSSYSHMPTCIDVTHARPADYFQGPWGDVTIRITFATWSLDPSGVRYPRQWSKEMNGQPYSTYTANEVKFNPVINEPDFAIPEDVRKASTSSPDLDEVPVGQANTVPLQVAPGVEYIYGPLNFNATEIRQHDGIVILEGVISSGYSAKIIQDAQKRFPGLPIKAVITTSDSWPHLGGIREYAARGIPIYALDLNRPILSRLLAAPHKQHPDALAKNPRSPKFTFVSQRTALGAGENRVEIIPFRTVTGERQMMVYFPAAKLVYTSDLFSVRTDGSIFLPEFAQEAVNSIARENLDVDRVYGMHYDPMPFQQLRDAIAKYLAPTS
ncbi:MAG TPA: hypothetical protein VIH72_02670 [Candidatus Acidoferrales bacterium]|jgi:hypothetical protein